MDVLAWIVGGGVLMGLIALVGSAALLLPDRVLERLLLPLVAFAAGSLIGGALFHMLPAVVGEEPGLGPFVWLAAGFLLFMALEQFLLAFQVMPVDEALAKQGGILRRQFRPSHGTGLADALVAAASMETESTLVTFNARHYPMIEQLEIPYER